MSFKIVKRLNLQQKFQKIMALGLWNSDIAIPDSQILDRIQRLNDDIEAQIYELYLPETQIDKKIEEIKDEYYQEKQIKKNKQEAVTKPHPKFDKLTNFTHLGRGVSSMLNHKIEDTTKILKNKLPSLPDAVSLSKLLGISVNKIKWLSYHREFANVRNYIEFKIMKKNGGERKISKPSNLLKPYLKIIKIEILDKLKFPYYVMGFIPKRSAYKNATEHQRSQIIFNVDIKKFFDNINYYQVRSSFHQLGYSGEISTVLALLLTKQTYTKVTIGQKSYWACSDFRSLPQGASTSPLVSNLVALKFDSQLITRSKHMGFKYSRYADDLTFSSTKHNKNTRQLLYMVRKTLELHGFKANENKTKLLLPHNRQEITGFIVNSNKPKVPKIWRRKLRAAVHQFRFIEDIKEKSQEYVRIMGCIQYLKQAHPQQASLYEIAINRYFKLHE